MPSKPQCSHCQSTPSNLNRPQKFRKPKLRAPTVKTNFLLLVCYACCFPSLVHIFSAPNITLCSNHHPVFGGLWCSPQARLPLMPFTHPEASYQYDWSHPNRKMVWKLSCSLAQVINEFPGRQTCQPSSLIRIVIDDRFALD